ncbi:hypothetical protein [Bacteroides thetaiotaomicron]|uniref:hypothetical protein n=1 Tax=Bacteroides thetaiotaomicron TaxID=818 RepID=UPI003569E265
MTPKEFFEKVEKMREAQKNYFKTRSSMDLQLSKKLEREIDNEIARVNQIINKPNPQSSLFGENT